MPVQPCKHIFTTSRIYSTYIHIYRHTYIYTKCCTYSWNEDSSTKYFCELWQATNANSSCTFIAYLSERSCETIALMGSIYARVCVCVCLHKLSPLLCCSNRGQLESMLNFAYAIANSQSSDSERALLEGRIFSTDSEGEERERGVCRYSVSKCVCVCWTIHEWVMCLLIEVSYY